MSADAGADLRKFIAQWHRLRTQGGDVRTPPGWRHATVEGFVLAYGRSWSLAARPPWLHQGPAGQCFRNAFELASDHPELTYVEGYAFRFIPVEYAWVVDAQGQVIDNTWDDGEAYFGVPLKTAYVRRLLLAQQHYGVLRSWRAVPTPTDRAGPALAPLNIPMQPSATREEPKMDWRAKFVEDARQWFNEQTRAGQTWRAPCDCATCTKKVA